MWGLKKLWILSCPRFIELGDAFGHLTSLEELRLTGVALERFPASFSLLSALKILFISGAKSLRSLQEYFITLKALKEVDISDCPLIKLPESPRSVSSLSRRSLASTLNDYSEHSGVDYDYEFFNREVLDDHEGSSDAGHVTEMTRRAPGSDCADQEIWHDEGQCLETAKGGSQSDCVEDFRTNIKERGEDGYFVRNMWLLSLEEHKRESLMSTLWEAGYSDICQTTTTTLFARSENDMRSPLTGIDTSKASIGNDVCPPKMDEVESLKNEDDKHGIPVEGFTARDEKVDITNVFSPMETDPGKRELKDGQLLTSELMEQRRHLSPRTMATKTPGTSTIGAHPAEQQAATWRSFTAAIESTDSFYVDTHWISKLKEDEQAAWARICLEAGYERTHQTSTTILFERIYGNTTNEGGDDGCDSKPSTSSQNKGADFQKPGKAESASLLGKRKFDGDQTDITRLSLGPALMTETSKAQDKICTCHPQILTVSCSSSSGAPEEIQPPPRKRMKMLTLGDVDVTLPDKVRSEMVTTTIDKRFSINTFDTSNGQEVPVNFKATVTSQLSCCLKAHNDRHKLRIKLSRIYGEVANESPNDWLCHATVLTTVCTNLLATRIDEEDKFDVISLKLENEHYHHPPHHILLPNTTPTRGDPMTTADRLVWLSMSNIFPKVCSRESTTVELRGDGKGGRKADTQAGLQRATVLHFQDCPRDSVIFEGDIDVVNPSTSYLELNVSHVLEVSYHRPLASVVGSDVWSTVIVPKRVDFDCSLDIQTDNFKVD
ncbi:unnamed protein product [Calypogeia fissa]